MSKKQLVVATITMVVLLGACSDSDAVVEIGSAQDGETTPESSETLESNEPTEVVSVADDSAEAEPTPPALDIRVREGSPYYSDLDPGLDQDGDGVVNALDLLPLDPSVGWDTDGDLIGDTVDPDADNDGVPNGNDAFPLDSSGWSDVNADGVADSWQWEITGDWETDRFVSERAQWGFATDLDDMESHIDAAVTSGISDVLSKEEGEQLELARSRVQDEAARELMDWLENHPSYVSTRTAIRGGGFVVLESSWTEEELVADGLPLDTVDDPSIVRFETRPYSRSEIRAGVAADVERLAGIEDETGLTFVYEDYDNTYGLTFYAVTHDPELPLLAESIDVLSDWRNTTAEPFRSLLYIDEPDVSDAWFREDRVGELPHVDEVDELPEDEVDELPEELPEDEVDELPEELPEDEVDELPEDAAVDPPVWLTFSFTLPESPELPEQRGVISSAGDSLVFYRSGHPHHGLSLFVDGSVWEISIGEWGNGWVPPTAELSGVDHEGLSAVFAPLLEAGVPISTVADVDVDGEPQSITYEVTGETTGTVTVNGLVIEVIFDAPEGGFVLPDPENVMLMPEDVSGENANPITVTWLEAVQ